MMLRRFLTAVMMAMTLAAFTSAAEGREIITSFHSVIDVAKSGTLTVTETIKVIADGTKIRHGIYRDFPLTMTSDDGKIQHVGFSIHSVERDGSPEDYHTETIPGGIRIYIGNSDVYLNGGEYSFQLTYETSRQIRYFSDHEELYWNVTGNAWDFPIEEATATVTLPEGVKADRTAVFTGPLDSKAKNARVMKENGEIFFATTAPLSLHEGLTIAVSMPKGSIDPPGELQKFIWWVRDQRNLSLAFTAFVLILLYYGFTWLRVGRDPYRGVVVPRWDAPDGLSPAMVNYIAGRGFTNGGWTALSAACLNLAVHGYAVLDDLKTSIRIKRTDKPLPQRMAPGEDVLLASLEKNKMITIDKANGKKIQKLGETFRGTIDKISYGRYYRYNIGYITLGIVLSVAAYASLIFFGDTSQNLIAFMIFPAVLTFFFGIFLTVIFRVVVQGGTGPGRVVGIVILGVLIMTATVIIGSITLVIFDQIKSAQEWALLYGAFGIILINVIALSIIGAPTVDGARLMAGVEGLKRYLTLAEKDRMNMQGAPSMSPKHFETLLPYAVALGVEKPWSDTFQSWLQTAAAADYQPAWYHGDRFTSRNFSSRMSTFSSSMSTTITSSLPPAPKSSSSGFSSGSSGGGSSGGGGGGGGGGGW